MSSFFGSFNTGTGAATTTVVVSGVGFEPKALIFWWSGRTESTDAIGRASQKRGFGVAVSATDRRSICDHSVDASASSDTATAHSDAACILSVSAANAIDGALDLQSMDADGFTLIVDDAMPVDLRVHFLALGTPITNVASIQFQIPASPGDQDITSLSFQPDGLLFFSNGETTVPPDASGNARFMVGAATGASNQGVLLTYASNGEATMDTRAYCTSGECIAMNNANVPPLIIERADFVSFLSNGFRLNWAEINATRYIHCLALKGGNYHVGNLLTQTDTTTDIVESGFGFPPASAMFFSHGQAESTSDTFQDNDRVSIGAFSGLTTRGAQGTLDEDAALTSEVTTAIEFDAVYVNISSASAVQGLMDVKSKDGDGFTMIMDDADPAQAFVWYAAFGSTVFLPASGSIAPTGTLVRQAQVVRGGSVALAGALVRQANKVFSGGITPSGALTRVPQTIYVGSIALAGTLVRVASKALAGAIALAGGLVKQVSTAYAGQLAPSGDPNLEVQTRFSGGITPTGALSNVKTAFLAAAGTIAPAGALVRQVNKLYAGTVGLAGMLIKQVNANYGGQITLTGNLIKQAQKVLAGNITPTGALGNIKLAVLGVAGSIIPVGTLTKQVNKPYAGTVGVAGALIRQANVIFSGNITPTSTLVNVKTAFLSVAGNITPAGALIRQVNKLYTSSIGLAGTLTRQANAIYSGNISLAGTLVKVAQKMMSGGITPSGVLSNIKTAFLSVGGSITPGGNLIKQVNKLYSGVITPLGDLIKQVGVRYSGVITPLGSLSKVAQRSFSGSIGLSGVLSNVLIPFTVVTRLIVSATDALTNFLNLTDTSSNSSTLGDDLSNNIKLDDDN